jgi:hypothetical protein
VTVETYIDSQMGVGVRKPARLALNWLRRHPETLETVKEVYAEGARGNPDAFRDFAAIVWAEVNGDFGGILEGLDVAPDDERQWVSTLALVVGAWSFSEMGQRGDTV